MACCILFDISSVFCQKIIFWILAIIFVRFGFFSKFSGLFFYMFWDISLKLGIYMQWVVLHVKFEFRSNRDTLTYFTAKNRSKSFICINGLKNHIEASDLVHTLILWVSWSVVFFVMVGQFLALWRTKHLKGGVTRAPSQRKVFRTFFVDVVRYQFATWQIHLVGGVTRQVRVSFQSGHFDLLYRQK